MARVVYVPELGRSLSFEDGATDQQISSYLKSNYPSPAASKPAEVAKPSGPDDSSILGRFGYGLATGFTEIPGGIAALGLPANKAAETSFGQFSEEARKYLQDVFGIDPTKDPTAAQQVAEALGGVAGFLIPAAGEAKIAGLIGAGTRAARIASTTRTAAQGATLNSAQRAETIRQQIASGMDIPEEKQLAAQRLDAFIGLGEAAPLHKFFGPIGTLLSKVPATQAPVVERIIQSRMVNIAKAGAEEGAQEAASNIASDIMEAGIYNPNVEIGQDVLSNFGTGAAAGSLTEGIIHLAMGRKAGPYRQLQQDLASERMQNAAALRQGRISQAAENLRQSGITGPVDVVPEEIDGLPRFTIKTPEGETVATFVTQDDAVKAVDLYKSMTGTDVMVREDITAPEVFPVKINDQQFNNIDEIKAARDKAIAFRKGTEKHITDPALLKKNATASGVSEEFYTQSVQKNLANQDVGIKKLNDFLALAEPKVKTAEPVVEIPKTTVPEATPKAAEALSPAANTVEPAPVEEAVSEAPIEPVVAQEAAPEAPVVEEPPIGTREFPTTEIAAEEPAVAEAPIDVAEPVAPEAPVEMRPSATAEQIADLQKELFDEVIGVRNMTPEQKATYEAERDKRFPPVPLGFSAGQASGVEKINTVPRPGTEFGGVDLKPEVKAVQDKVYAELQKRFQSIAPPEVGLGLSRFIDKGEGYLIHGYEAADESGKHTNGVINIATGIYDPNLSVEDLVKKLMGVLNHEAIHSIRRSGLIRPAEWRILSKAVENTKIPGKKYTYLDKASAIYTEDLDPSYANPDAVVEEAVAEMYKDWVNGKRVPNQTMGLFNRITEFLRRIFRSLKSTKYENVFNAIESGEVRGREISQQDGRGSVFSAAPVSESEDFKNWVAGSKLVNEDGSPLKLYTGTSKDTIFESFKDSDRGTWVTTDPSMASDYSISNDSMGTKIEFGPNGREYVKTNMKSRVIPVYASAKNILDLSTRAKQDAFYKENNIPTFGGASGYQKEQAAIGRIAMLRGYDAIQWGPGVWAIFNPKKNIKSQFNEFTAKSIASPKFSAAPLPTYLEQQNQNIFAPVPNVSFKDMVFDMFGFGGNNVAKTLNTQHGTIQISEKTMRNISRRMNVVDRNAYIAHLEKLANEQDNPGQFERMVADDSALASLVWRGRASHVNASMIIKGKLTLNYARPGDLLSATMKVEDDPDSLLNISKILLEPGPTAADGKQKDKREVFKMYATAKRGIGLKADGKPLPAGITDQYIRDTIPFVEQNYPEVAEAYRMYQRFNKNLLTTAMNSGLISQQELADLTKRMDYYGYYREAYQEDIVPTSSQKTASRFSLREYKGSERGGLINDPLYVMLQNSHFWVDSIAKNIAATKSFNLLRRMREARLLGTGEKPNRDIGEEEQVMFYMDNGSLKRFAVKDPMLAVALGSDDRIDLGSMMKWLGMPTHILRESVTRDPGFMFANLARDTMSTWITSGEDIIPFISTVKGFTTALRNGSSFQELMGRGVVGSYDLGMKDPKQLAATIARRAAPKNIHTVTSPRGLINATQSLWDKMGSLSEASDAATRVAVYEAARAQGMSEAEASLRAIEIMDFSRHGSNQILSVLTKLIPFLNARIQGLDVVWQAAKAGGKLIAGKQQSERDTQIGKKFLVRGGILAVISMALEMINEDDEDYKGLEDYIKNSNVLIPLKHFGLKGEFLAIPKPFESGLLFSTFPQQFYKSMQGDATARENIGLFTSSLASTFGVNPIPQLLLPAVEVMTNHDFYTGLPLIPEGKSRLSPELQYNAGTSSLAMMIGSVPVMYNLTSGKFEGISPIVIDNLIGGYGGPLGTYIAQVVSIGMETFNVGPERLPQDVTKLPIVRRFFIDSETKSPKVVSQAYELFGLADEANRSFSRLRQMGDVEATMDYLEENRTILSYKKYIFKLVDGLNDLTARERAIERDSSMTRDDKLAAVKNIRDMKIRIASKVAEINKALGR